MPTAATAQPTARATRPRSTTSKTQLAGRRLQAGPPALQLRPLRLHVGGTGTGLAESGDLRLRRAASWTCPTPARATSRPTADRRRPQPGRRPSLHQRLRSGRLRRFHGGKHRPDPARHLQFPDQGGQRRRGRGRRVSSSSTRATSSPGMTAWACSAARWTCRRQQSPWSAPATPPAPNSPGSAALKMRLAVDAGVSRIDSFNILADTGGRADRTVVVGAHLDSVAEGPRHQRQRLRIGRHPGDGAPAGRAGHRRRPTGSASRSGAGRRTG